MSQKPTAEDFTDTNIVHLHGQKLGGSGDGPIKGGGGGDDGMSGLEARVTALESKFEKIDYKLDQIVNDVSGLKDDAKKSREDLSYIKGKIEGLPLASEFGQLKAGVVTLPKLSAALGIVVAAIAIINNWAAVKAALF